jgi:hypothetical protein
MPITVRGTDILFNDSTTQATAAPKLVRINTFLTSRTYTVPSGVTALMIFAVGASGGRVTELSAGSSPINGGGQGGCGYAEKYITTPAASYVITIGAGGLGATAGGTTTIDTISITSSAAVTGDAGSAGGVASGGTFNANGGAGGSASSLLPPSNIRSGGGSGAGGSRAGAGFAGANGSEFNPGVNNSYGGGGGGGGSGGAGQVATNSTGGAGGVAATTTSASAVSVGQYFTPAGAAGIFPSGSPGLNGFGNGGGQGGVGAPGLSMYYSAGSFDVQMIRGPAGSVNQRFFEYAQSGFPGAVQIWEFY